MSEVRRKQNRRYMRSPKGRAAVKRYRASPKGRAAQKRYRESAKGRAAQKRYRESAKGRATREDYNAVHGYLKSRERVLLKERARVERELECLKRTTRF